MDFGQHQRGHPLKYQRYGSSKNFVKVTGRTSLKCINYMVDIGDENEKRALISYVNQLIVNPVNFHVFEMEVTDITNVDLVLNSLLRQKNMPVRLLKLICLAIEYICIRV